MTKTIGNVGTILQTFGHEGIAECPVFIQRLDAIYEVGEIKVYSNPNGDKFCIIEARGHNE